MSRSKKRTSQLLALFLAVVLVFSNLGSVAAVADTITATGGGVDCGISTYLSTDEIDSSYKSDSTQTNKQSSANITEETFTTSFLQSAEWVDKSAGTAKLNIHYEADLVKTANRSVYLFTTCTVHGFTEELAIENIIEMMNYNAYVDVIMIGVTNYSKGGSSGSEETNVGAVMQFTLYSGDFENLNDGIYFDEDNGTYYYTDSTQEETKASIIKALLETYTNEGFISGTYSQYAHELGCDEVNGDIVISERNCCGSSEYEKDDTYTEGHISDGSYYYDGTDKSYGPYIEVLYSSVNDSAYSSGYVFGDSSQIFYSAAALGLTFQRGSHAGGLFSFYFIAEYINIIGTDNFDSVVGAIFNSFDAFSVVNKNLDSNYTTATLYEEIQKYTGLDLTSSSMSLANLPDSIAAALAKMQEYKDEGRYVALIPGSNDETSDALSFDSANTNYANLTEYSDAWVATVNTAYYVLGLITPDETITDADGAKDVVTGWIKDGTRLDITSSFSEYNPNVYTYESDLETTNALIDVYTKNTVTITTTVASEFTFDKNDITVTNSGGENSSFAYEIVSVNPGDEGTEVTIEFTNFEETETDDWIIDISITVQLKENTKFCTDDYDFKDTNIGEAKAVLTAVTEDDDDRVTPTNTIETVYVASPVLYKADSGSLTISKTVAGNPTEDERAQYYNFTVVLDGSISGTYDTIYYTDGAQTGTGKITFESGSITAVNNDESINTISLMDGESVTIYDLPAGISYTVTEGEVDEHCVVGVNGQIGKATTGIIEAGEAVEAAFVNRYETGALIISKVVEVEDVTSLDTEKMFAFTVSVENLEHSVFTDAYEAIYTYQDGTMSAEKITFDESGSTTIYLKHLESVIITGLPDGTSYTVTETESSREGFTVYVNNVQSESATATGEIANHTISSAAFTNDIGTVATGDLIVSKVVDDESASSEGVFVFTIQLDLEDYTDFIAGEYGGIYFSADGTGTVTLSHGQSVVATGLPAGIGYTVTETDSGGYEVSSTGASGEIVAGATVSAAFYNYEEITPELEIKKTGTDTTGAVAKTVAVGDTITYTLDVSQTVEDAIATNVEVVDEVPSGLTIDEDSVVVKVNNATLTGVATVSDNTLTVNLDYLSYGDTLTITYTVTVDEGTEGSDLTNVATATADNAEEVEDEWTITVDNEEEELIEEEDPIEEEPIDEEDPIEEEPIDEGDDPLDDPEEGVDDEDEGTDSDDPGTSETDSDDTTGTDDDTTGTLPKTGDSIGALLVGIVSAALGACAVALLAVLALRKRGIR